MTGITSLVDMPSVTQNNRLLFFYCSLGNDELLAHRFHGYEAVDEPGIFTVELLSQKRKIDEKALIGSSVALGIRMADGNPAWRHGLVQSLRYLGADAGWHCWQLDFSSWLSLLNYKEDCRIWMDKTIINIFEDIFSSYAEAQGQYIFDLRNEYSVNSYITQFNETDSNFIHRWMEHYGIFCYIIYEKEKHTVVFTDDIDTLAPGIQPVVRFHSQEVNQKEDSLFTWQPTHTLHSGKQSYAGRDYLRHTQPHQVQENTLSASAANNHLERYRYAGQYAWSDDNEGLSQARVRMEAMECAAARIEAWSGIRGFSVGTTFSLAEHPLVDSNMAYAVLALHTFAESNLPMASECRDMPESLGFLIRDARLQAMFDLKNNEQEKNKSATYGQYFNKLICQSVHTAFRLEPITPKPTIGIQTAIVTAPSGHEVYTDTLNRIRVKFNWDRLHSDDDATSCWLRMMQASSGEGWGAIHIPRAGEEVLVGFLDNNIDRPVVLGQLYGGNKPAWHSHGLMSGYRSKEIQGQGYNQLLGFVRKVGSGTFEDAA